MVLRGTGPWSNIASSTSLALDVRRRSAEAVMSERRNCPYGWGADESPTIQRYSII